MVLTDIGKKESVSLTNRSHARFVECEEFCQLLLGFKKLVRADNPARGLRGLLDEATNTLYVIEQDRLASYLSHEEMPSCPTE